MSQFFKKRWPLCLVLIVFIIAKVPYLNVAYYWDESWPYAAAVREMYRHGVSLLPSALDADLSKGHPLFFHALAASWMHIFGTSYVAVHSFALTLSVFLLLIVYETALSLFDMSTAVLALLLVVAQEVFFVQSSMLLPEVLVALLCFLSIVCYAREKYVWAMVCLAMLFYTKETGVIAGLVIGLDALISLFNKQTPLRTRVAKILTPIIPCLLLCLFFALQKQLRGWYLYPDHIQKMHFDWATVWFSLRMDVIRWEFYERYRYYIFLLPVLLAIIAAIKQKQPRYLSILLPAICIWYFVDNMRAGRLLPSIPFFIVFIASAFYFLYESSRLFTARVQKKLIMLFGTFVLCYLIFSGMNFFTPRYLLASMVPMFFITAAILNTYFQRTWQWLIYPVIACIVLVTTAAWLGNDHFGDCDLKSINALRVHEEVVNYFEKNVSHSANISTGLCLEGVHLSNPGTGFLHSGQAYKQTRWDIDGQSDYVVFDNIEGDSRYEDFKKNPNFELVKRIEKGKVWGEIYKRKQ